MASNLFHSHDHHDHSNCGGHHHGHHSHMHQPKLVYKKYSSPILSSAEIDKLKKYEKFEDNNFIYESYTGETKMKLIENLCSENLSEPYSVFTFRYFVNKWPYLTYLAMDKNNNNKCVGLIICRLLNKKNDNNNKIYEGYIAMLVVDINQRRKGLGTKLVKLSINKMIKLNADQIMLETEQDNYGALKLYKKLGFIKDLKYRNYYLNGNGAYRLKLYLTQPKPLTDKPTMHY